MLLTTEPVTTMPQLLRVVGHYRARWLVEEYFKALKTGCSLEKRQSGSYQALVKVTALLAPVAYRLLLLRSLERQNPSGPASTFFDPVDLKLMCMDDATRGLASIDSLATALQYLARMGTITDVLDGSRLAAALKNSSPSERDGRSPKHSDSNDKR